MKYVGREPGHRQFAHRPDAVTDPALVERSAQHPMGWYLLERNKPSRKARINRPNVSPEMLSRH
jgi:hypothetical protein